MWRSSRSTIERQCDNEFIKDLAPAVERSQAVVSFGAGVQALAERFPGKPVYPGLNTQFLGTWSTRRLLKSPSTRRTRWSERSDLDWHKACGMMPHYAVRSAMVAVEPGDGRVARDHGAHAQPTRGEVLMRSLPRYSTLVANYPKSIDKPTKVLLDEIGGEVRAQLSDSVNTCAIRMSVALNKSDRPIQPRGRVYLLRGKRHSIRPTRGSSCLRVYISSVPRR